MLVDAVVEFLPASTVSYPGGQEVAPALVVLLAVGATALGLLALAVSGHVPELVAAEAHALLGAPLGLGCVLGRQAVKARRQFGAAGLVVAYFVALEAKNVVPVVPEGVLGLVAALFLGHFQNGILARSTAALLMPVQ